MPWSWALPLNDLLSSATVVVDLLLLLLPLTPRGSSRKGLGIGHRGDDVRRLLAPPGSWLDLSAK